MDYQILPIPGKYTFEDRPVCAWYYGRKLLSGKSWWNLKKRLSASGFYTLTDRDRQTVRLYWSV